MAPKNVLVLYTDQQRYDSLGCTGNPFARTPNLDRLGAEGCVFTRHVAGNPVCMPSRASFLTGLYPPGHNVWQNGVPLARREYERVCRRDYMLPGFEYKVDLTPEPATMADVFAAAGYDTAAFGKLHLTPNNSAVEAGFGECWGRLMEPESEAWHGPYYGFRHVEITTGHGEQPCWGGHYGHWLRREHPDLHARVMQGPAEKPLPGIGDLYPSPVPHALHHGTWLAERFVSYLTKERPMDRPFFAFVGFPDPHHPFTPSEDVLRDFLDAPVQEPHDPEGEGLVGGPLENAALQRVNKLTPEQRRTILRYTYAMVHQVDRAVGTILDALRAAGAYDETIVVFTSDHGDFLCDHARLRKGVVGSDALLHVPFLLRAPGAGLPSRIDAPMSNVDALPTLTALAGVEAPADLHGLDVTAGGAGADARRVLAYCYDGEAEKQNITVYDDRFRMTWYPRTGAVELFDHADDPGECRNLAAAPSQAERVREFQRYIEHENLRHVRPRLGRVAVF